MAYSANCQPALRKRLLQLILVFPDFQLDSPVPDGADDCVPGRCATANCIPDFLPGALQFDSVTEILHEYTSATRDKSVGQYSRSRTAIAGPDPATGVLTLHPKRTRSHHSGERSFFDR